MPMPNQKQKKLAKRKTFFLIGLGLLLLGLSGILFTTTRTTATLDRYGGNIAEHSLTPPTPPQTVAAKADLEKVVPLIRPKRLLEQEKKKVRTRHHAQRSSEPTSDFVGSYLNSESGSGSLSTIQLEPTSASAEHSSLILVAPSACAILSTENPQLSPTPSCSPTPQLTIKRRGTSFFGRIINFIKKLFGVSHQAKPQPQPNRPPTVSSLVASSSTIMLPCPEGAVNASCTPSATPTVTLLTTAADPDNDELLYTYSVTGGLITGDGSTVSWDLGNIPGTFTASVEVDDGRGCVAFSSTIVSVAACSQCSPPPCPIIPGIECPTQLVQEGSPAVCAVPVSAPGLGLKYFWTVSNNSNFTGQGSQSIVVDTRGHAGQTITVGVEIGGEPPACGTGTQSGRFSVRNSPPVSGNLGGTVVDSNGAAIANALIEVLDSQGAVVKETRTNQEGFFNVTSLEPGTYTIRVLVENFKRADFPATVVIGQSNSLTLTIEPSGQSNATPSPAPTAVSSPPVTVNQPTPCPSPTPVAKNRVGVEYPKELENETFEYVTVSLTPNNGQADTNPEQPNFIRRVFHWFYLKTGGTPETGTTGQTFTPPVPENACRYNGYARAYIDESRAFEYSAAEGCPKDFQALDSQRLCWKWKITGKKPEVTRLKVHLEFKWDPKPNSGVEPVAPEEVWATPGKGLELTVYNKSLWNGAVSVVGWLFSGIGAAIMSVIVAPWIKIKYLKWRQGNDGASDQGNDEDD